MANTGQFQYFITVGSSSTPFDYTVNGASAVAAVLYSPNSALSGDTDDIRISIPATTKQFNYFMNDDGVIPSDATISTVFIRFDQDGAFGSGTFNYVFNGTVNGASGSAASSFVETSFATNPVTGLAWTRADLFSVKFGAQIVAFGSHKVRRIALRVTGFLTTSSLSPTSGPTAGGTLVTMNTDMAAFAYAGADDVTESTPNRTYFTVNGIGLATMIGVTRVSNSQVTGTTPAHASGPAAMRVSSRDADDTIHALVQFASGVTTVFYTFSSPSWALNWSVADPPYQFISGASTIPSNFTTQFDSFADGTYFPTGSSIPWAAIANPDVDGWWLSANTNFGGAAYIVDNSRPTDPRSFVEVGSFATGSTGMMGGFPGPAGVFNNKLVYAPGGYTVGTDLPTIRMFDGQFDRIIGTLPKTSSGGVPKAVMSILVANGTIYLSTLDSGASSADWLGRVFSLDPINGNFTPLGGVFPTGHVPYALTFHMGRLWCGTHRQSASASGQVFFFRPFIDTAWTSNHDLSADGQANVCSMLSYKGLLYIGCSAAAGTFAKVLVRGVDGTYGTSNTGSGGAAIDNNAFLAMSEFQGNLYASYFNNDAPKVSKIYKFDNSSWTTAFTGSGTTLIPFVSLPVDLVSLFAIGGGKTFDGTLLFTSDGSTWTDRTAFLTQIGTNSTGLPCFGVLVR